MAIEAPIKWVQCEQRVGVEDFRVLHFALNLNGPRAGGQGTGILGGLVFLNAELVEIVVVGQVLKAGELLAGGSEGTLHRLQFAVGQSSDPRREHFSQPLSAQCRGACAAGSSDGSAQKTAAIEELSVILRRSDFRRRNI